MSTSKSQKEGFLQLPKYWEEIWSGMPSFHQEQLTSYQAIYVHLRGPEDREKLAAALEQKLTERTKSIWYPKMDFVDNRDLRWVSKDKTVRAWLPKYPIYVISKGRWESRLTVKALEGCGAPYHVVIEPQEYEQYAAVIDPKKILTLPFSNLGQGSIPARNWVWDHALKKGAARHWILDDNIRCFYRLYNNRHIRIDCPNMFRVIEDLSDRYENVGVSGMHYFMFVPRKDVIPPFYLNTRVYSCILINNAIKHRWRGRYNEDTDLSLRVLKDGWCTILTTAINAEKMPTMTMRGGNTDELYAADGRLLMAQELKKWHPDVTTVSRKWGRWQHHVNYEPFRKNKLILKKDAPQCDKSNEYGMKLVHIKPGSAKSFSLSDDKPILVGQAPGKEGGSPLTGRVGKRLARLMGISYKDYIERTERINVLDRYPGAAEHKGDLFPMKEAKACVKKLLGCFVGRRVLFLGKVTAKAFGHDEVKLFEWQESSDSTYMFAVCPHPSGVATWWNKIENENRASSFLGLLLPQEEV